VLIKTGQHHRSKHRCQELCWKVHNQAQSFVLCSYSMYELRNQNATIGLSVRSKQLLCFVHCEGQTSEQKRTTKNFVGFHHHSPLLTMVRLNRSRFQCLSKIYSTARQCLPDHSRKPRTFRRLTSRVFERFHRGFVSGLIMQKGDFYFLNS